MKKLILAVLCFAPIANLQSQDVKKIIPSPDGRLQYYPKISSLTIGDLGLGTQILDEGILQGGATWFNFVGANVVASVNGGTVTVTVSGSAGSGGGGSGAYFDGSQSVSVTTWTIPYVVPLFNASFATVPVFAATPTFTGSPTFNSSATFLVPISSLGIRGNLVVVGSMTAWGVITSTSGALLSGTTVQTLNFYDGSDNIRLQQSGTGLQIFINNSQVGSWSSNQLVPGVPVRAPNGTLLLPAYSFNNQSDSGFYIEGSGVNSRVNYVVDAKDVMKFADTKLISIGAIEPRASLHVATAGSVNLPILIVSSNNWRTFEIMGDSTSVQNQLFVSSGATFSSATVKGDFVVIGSASIMGILTSTTGAMMGASTFTALTVSGSSIATANYTLVFPTAPVAGQHLFVAQVNGVNAVIAGGGDNAGSGSGGNPPSLQNPTTGIHNLQSDSGSRFGIANSTGIEVGQNLQLTTWMSTATLTASGSIKGSIVWDFDPVSLHALTTDFAVTDSTSAKLNFYLGALYDKATTNYRWGKRILPTNLDISSVVYFSAVIRSTNPTAGSNVQILFLSSATSVTGPSFLDLANSTGADVVPLTNNQAQLDVANWSQSVSNLKWFPDFELFFKLGRGHDTSKLLTTDYAGGLYILSFRITIPVILPNSGLVDNLGNHKQTQGIDSAGFSISGSSALANITRVAIGTAATPTSNFIFQASTTTDWNQVAITTTGHTSFYGAVPALTSCGSGPTITGSDSRMVITVGATGTGCTITFGSPYKNAPSVNVFQRTMSLVNALTVSALSNSLLTFAQVGAAGSVYDVWVDGIRE